MAIRSGSRLDDGTTLPFDWFCDPAIFAEEQRRIFAGSWVYAGPDALAAEPGAFFTCHVGLVPVVVVRGHDGELRAFVNICRHRATEVARGCGRRETLQCPYHAWTYNLDGSLRAAPRSDREPGFDPSGLGLLPLAVDTWGPLIFVNRDIDAGPLADVLGPLPRTIAEAGIDLGDLRYRARDTFEIAANWKAVAENYLECYHCPAAHPGFSQLIDVDPDAYHLSSGAWHSSQISRVRDRALARGVAHRTNEAHFHYVWPTFTLNTLPGPRNVAIFCFVPLSPDRTLTTTDYFYGDEATDAEIEEQRAFAAEVAAEDQDLVESIQRAAAAGALDDGRLLLSSEHLIQHFQKLVERALA